jgi:hypothetical protein
MNTNTQQQSENNKIDINNMFKTLALFDLGPPELQETIRTDAPAEEIIADLSAASLFEEQDDALFALKHTQESLALYSREEEAAENTKIPRKRLKTFHEHPIPEPMEICESKTTEKQMYSCCASCVLTDGRYPSHYCHRAYPDRVIDDESDEEREIDEYDPHREFRRADTVDDENEMEIWILEQEAKRRYPRRRRPEGIEDVAVRLFEDELIMPILDDNEFVPEMPVLQRQNTQFTVNGVTVFNGNPNGSRFFDDYEEYWDVLSSIV